MAWERYIEESEKPGMPTRAAFVVCLTAIDEVIGGMSIDHLDLINRTGETGTFLFAPFRNQGYGPEAKHLLLEYCFDHLHLHAICSHVWEPNTRSAAALEKQGYRFAGRLKWDDYKDGVYRDTLVFDLLRNGLAGSARRLAAESPGVLVDRADSTRALGGTTDRASGYPGEESRPRR